MQYSISETLLFLNQENKLERQSTDDVKTKEQNSSWQFQKMSLRGAASTGKNK
jgi:hypothetical protein